MSFFQTTYFWNNGKCQSARPKSELRNRDWVDYRTLNIFFSISSTPFRSEVRQRTSGQRMWHEYKSRANVNIWTAIARFSCMRRRKEKKRKKNDLRSKQTCISAIQGSSPYEMPEVCQCVMSAHGRFHRPGNNKPLPVHQPCGLSDESSPLCRYEWEECRLFTLYESICDCGRETDINGAICLLSPPEAQPWWLTAPPCHFLGEPSVLQGWQASTHISASEAQTDTL